jgi:hypothetical protein
VLSGVETMHAFRGSEDVRNGHVRRMRLEVANLRYQGWSPRPLFAKEVALVGVALFPRAEGAHAPKS